MAVNIITQDFTYDVPDEYLLKTNANGDQHTCSYTGPEAIYVAVNKETGRIDLSRGWEAVTADDSALAMMNVRAGEGCKVVKVLFSEEPVICWLIVEQLDLDRDAGEQKEYKLPGDDKVYYSRPAIIYPDHCYEESEIRYNVVTDSWVKPFPWKNPHMEWPTILNAGLGVAESRQAELDADNEFTDEQITACEAYIAELKGLEAKFKGKTWADGSAVQPWQVPFPDDPIALPEPTTPVE